MTSKWISVPSADGRSFDAYVCQPETGRGPGLLLIQEIFGVNEHIQAVARQYAADGFVVIAPDIFWRDSPRVDLAYDNDGFDRGLALLSKLNVNLAATDMQRAVEALRHENSCTGRVGSVGFCMGGMLSFVAAARAGVDTAVCYYGGGIDQRLNLVADISCPLLFHFAEKDSYIPAAAVEKTRQALAGRNNVRILVHPGVDHGFNCWRRPAWHQQTAARARGQTLVHLSESLG
jgi:carboxymethylenebutenolidase